MEEIFKWFWVFNKIFEPMQSGVKNVDEEVKILILLKVESVVGFQVEIFLNVQNFTKRISFLPLPHSEKLSFI